MTSAAYWPIYAVLKGRELGGMLCKSIYARSLSPSAVYQGNFPANFLLCVKREHLFLGKLGLHSDKSLCFTLQCQLGLRGHKDDAAMPATCVNL